MKVVPMKRMLSSTTKQKPVPLLENDDAILFIGLYIQKRGQWIQFRDVLHVNAVINPETPLMHHSNSHALFASISSHPASLFARIAFAFSRFSLVLARRSARRHLFTSRFALLQLPMALQRNP